MRLARGPMGPGLLRTPAGDLPPRRDKPAAAKGLRWAKPRAADKCQLRARAGPRNPSNTGFIWEYHILSLGRDNRTR